MDKQVSSIIQREVDRMIENVFYMNTVYFSYFRFSFNKSDTSAGIRFEDTRIDRVCNGRFMELPPIELMLCGDDDFGPQATVTLIEHSYSYKNDPIMMCFEIEYITKHEYAKLIPEYEGFYNPILKSYTQIPAHDVKTANLVKLKKDIDKGLPDFLKSALVLMDKNTIFINSSNYKK